MNYSFWSISFVPKIMRFVKKEMRKLSETIEVDDTVLNSFYDNNEAINDFYGYLKMKNGS